MDPGSQPAPVSSKPGAGMTINNKKPLLCKEGFWEVSYLLLKLLSASFQPYDDSGAEEKRQSW